MRLQNILIQNLRRTVHIVLAVEVEIAQVIEDIVEIDQEIAFARRIVELVDIGPGLVVGVVVGHRIDLLDMVVDYLYTEFDQGMVVEVGIAAP